MRDLDRLKGELQRCRLLVHGGDAPLGDERSWDAPLVPPNPPTQGVRRLASGSVAHGVVEDAPVTTDIPMPAFTEPRGTSSREDTITIAPNSFDYVRIAL